MRGKFSGFLLLPQILFIILFGVFVEYDTVAGPRNASSTAGIEEFDNLYPMFQDVHVMIFIGFGFLMTFLKRYGFGSVGFNFMLAAFVIQWTILMRGCLDLEDIKDGKINISLESFLNADFACGAVLISFGAVLGVLGPIQLIVMAVLEVVFYSVNEFVIAHKFQISDIGGSMVIHTFGAYFGLAVSLMHWKPEFKNSHPKEESVYHADIFAMIGTLFLWLFWPSFNGAPAAGSIIGERAVINTVFSLAAAGVCGFAMSSIVDKSGKISMVHVQNATLAGGVAAGAVANLKLGPLGAIIIGSASGLLSVAGYAYITPAIQKHMKIHDTCGVHNLHGMPGVLSGFAAVVFAKLTTATTYTDIELAAIYPGRVNNLDFQQQANLQLAGLAVTLGIAIFGGIFTGLLLKLPFLEGLKYNDLFEDSLFWNLEDDVEIIKEVPLKKIKQESTKKALVEQTSDNNDQVVEEVQTSST
uniref:rh type A glycoprotein isoform X1 n=1 Tax=Ciona intestinalis TaxID=7719 RepID=UPI0000522A14|nr:rh type A glycoprotein isoform X1 [Ciona intestinalis]|eukprot:XP_009857884.1 rh type A glycoprotein isoform X1 [Ciona intestinalis]